MRIRLTLATGCSVLMILLLALVSGQLSHTVAQADFRLGPKATSAIRPSTGNWQIETVEYDVNIQRDTSLALDESGHPHIVYGENGTLKYARYDGTNWHIEILDSSTVGTVESALALDGQGHPHIGYQFGHNWEVKHAWHDGTTWHIESVRSGFWGSGYALHEMNGDIYYSSDVSIAIDALGRPHISYTYSVLEYAWYDGGTWHFEEVDPSSFVYNYNSLALDVANRPRISYYHAGDEDLKFAWRDGATWRIETVDSAGDVGKDTSLALDDAGLPHISYCDYTNRNLKYAWNDGTSWHVETVDDGFEVGDHNALALDTAGRPHISYLDSWIYDLKYAWHDGITWHIETVDVYIYGYQGEYTSIALDALDQPHIAHHTYNALDYVYRVPLTPISLNKETTPGDDLHYNGTLTYTLTISAPGLGVRLWDPLPDTVHYVPGSIMGSITPMAVYNPTTHAITWEGTLPSDTVQEVRFQVTPDITVTKSLAAPLPIVNTAWLTDTDNDRIITATATVNLLPIPLSLDKQAMPHDRLRNKDLLTYTLTLYGPGLSARLRDSLPDTVHYVPGSITGTITPAASYSSTVRAVVWEGTLPTDTVQTVRFQVTPGITGTGSLSLSFPIVNTAWLTSTESGRSVMALSIVNGTHVYLPCVVRGY